MSKDKLSRKAVKSGVKNTAIAGNDSPRKKRTPAARQASKQDAAALAKKYILEQNYEQANFWLNKIPRNNSIEDLARHKLAVYQEALDDNDYAELIKWLENAAREGMEIAGAMLALDKKEGKNVSRKYRSDAEFHLSQAMKAEEADDLSTAKAELIKSFKSFLPAIESIKTREYAGELKESFSKLNWERRNLTHREAEILKYLLEGTAPKEIAYNLHISYPTVNFHINNLYRKMGIQSRAELFAMFKK